MCSRPVETAKQSLLWNRPPPCLPLDPDNYYLLGLTADDKLRWQAQVSHCFHVWYFRLHTYIYSKIRCVLSNMQQNVSNDTYTLLSVKACLFEHTHTHTHARARLNIAPGPTVHWLFRSNDLPSKFSAIASRLCDTRNRAVKHMNASPLLRKCVVVSAVQI